MLRICCFLLLGLATLGSVQPLSIASAEDDNKKAKPIRDRLIEYYGDRANYNTVRRDVIKWHKTTRNGCVAFVSTALRHVGVKVPQNEKRDGWGVSRITFAFVAHLEEQGWTRSTDISELKAGDIVLTTGFPDHVFVFHSWRNRKRQLARVIDNKGFRVTRSLASAATRDDSPFAFALQEPAGQVKASGNRL